MDEIDHRVLRHGTTGEESLDLLATVLGDLKELVLRFDAFSDRHHAEAVAKSGDGPRLWLRVTSTTWETPVNSSDRPSSAAY